MDPSTQEKLRNILRGASVAIADEAIEAPIHAFVIHPVPLMPNPSQAILLEQARQLANEDPWTVDIGHSSCGVSRSQADRIRNECRESGVPFWESHKYTLYEVLEHPSLFPEEFAEVCAFFGEPVPPLPAE